jgi:hypothetical protein
MSVVNEMRAQMQSKKASAGNAWFYGLASLVILGSCGAVGYMMFGQASGPVRMASAGSVPVIASAGVAKAAPAISSRNRIGTRERSEAAASCVGHLPMTQMIMMSGPDVAVGSLQEQKLKQQQVPAGFAMLDGFVKIGFLVKANDAIAGRNTKESSTSTAGPMMADFVDCMIRKPPEVLCDPDNRAAALSYLNGFVKSIREHETYLAKLSPMERHREQNWGGSVQRRTVLNSIAIHAKAGSLIRDDFGWTIDGEVKAVFEANPAQRNACASVR